MGRNKSDKTNGGGGGGSTIVAAAEGECKFYDKYLGMAKALVTEPLSEDPRTDKALKGESIQSGALVQSWLAIVREKTDW